MCKNVDTTLEWMCSSAYAMKLLNYLDKNNRDKL